MAKHGLTPSVLRMFTPVPCMAYLSSLQRSCMHKVVPTHHHSSTSSNSWQQWQRQHTGHCTQSVSGTAEAAAPEDDWLQRSRLLVGANGLRKLAAANVLLVGLGGVGSFAAEFLCRAGVGRMTIVDGDTIDTTNRNRQLPATKGTIGQLKSEVVASRLLDINPDLQLTVKQEFLDPARAAGLVQEQQYHFVIDCIDSVAPKQALLLAGHAAGCRVVSSMGAGGRLDPSRVRLADISATHNDAFAAVVRRGLRKAGVSSGVTVVFSDELAKPASLALTQQQYKKSYFGTCSYIPGLFGLYIASHIIREVVDSTYKAPAPALAQQSNSKGAVASAGRSSSSSRKKQKAAKAHRHQQNGYSSEADAVNTTVLAGIDGTVFLSSTDKQTAMGKQQASHRREPSSVRLTTAQLAAAPAAVAAATAVTTASAMAPPQAPTAVAEPAATTSHDQAETVVGVCPVVQHLPSSLSSFDSSQGCGMGFDGEGI